jgi:hypothetical protein
MDQGTCPVCNGTKRIPVSASAESYKDIIAGYDKVTDTFACNNCGGQYMYGKSTGLVKLREDGTPCQHEYTGKTVSNCYHRYVCKHCGDMHHIDSGD